MLKLNYIKIIIMSMVLMVGTNNMASADKISKKNAQMKMHHLHMIMNKGILLATEGSNLIMLSRMKMLPGVDDMTAHHGSEMMKEAKPLINRTMSGPVIMELHSKQYINDPLLHYTEKLGKAMIDAVDILDTMCMKGIESADSMKMSHLHNLLNHALEMAAEGSNLAILGHMSKTGKVMDEYSIKQGNQMMKNARSILSATMGSQTMMDLHASGTTVERDPMMRQFHSFAEAAMNVIDMLIKMPAMD
jgi:hypothetical protein